MKCDGGASHPEVRRRILIVTHDFPPLNSSASRRPFSWARTWTDMGHEVHVLTTAKYPHDRLTDASQDMKGISVHEVRYLPWLAPAGVKAAATGLKPAPIASREARRWFDLLRKVTRRVRLGLGLFTEKTTLAYLPMRRAGIRLLGTSRFDLIVSTSGPDVCPLVAGALARISGVFWLSDYRDLWFDEFAVNRYVATTWFVNRMQSRLLRRAGLVSTVSLGLAGYLERVVPGKVTICYNGYLEAPPPQPRAYPGAATVKIVYTGTFYPEKRDPAIFFDGVRALLAEREELQGRLRVDLYGPIEPWVAAQVRERGLEAFITLRGSVAYEESLAAQGSANALLFVDWMDDRAEGVLTGKLFEYLACAAPILCIGTRGSTEAAGLISACGAGRVAVTPAQVRDALLSLLSGGWPLVPDAVRIAQFSRKAQAEALLDQALTVAFGRDVHGTRI